MKEITIKKNKLEEIHLLTQKAIIRIEENKNDEAKDILEDIKNKIDVLVNVED